MRSFAATLLILASGAAQAQIFSPVIALREPPPPVGAEMMVTSPYLRSVGPFLCGPLQLSPSLAWNGGDYLAVWIEEVPRPSVFAARLRRDGVTLDGRGIRVSESELFQRNVVAASSGRELFLIWVEETIEQNPVAFLRARRLSLEGSPIGPVLTLSQTTAADSRPALAWDGTNYLAVWEAVPGGNKDLVAARITPDGVVLDTPPIRVDSRIDRNPASPSITWSGTTYLIVWTESDRATECSRLPCPFVAPRHIHAARLSPEGVVLDQPSLQIATGAFPQSNPDVAWNGETFLVTWSLDEPNLRRGVWAKRLAPSGVILEEPNDPTGIQVVRNVGSDLLTGRVESDGTGFLVVWQVNDGDKSIWGSRVSREGFLLDGGTAIGGFPLANSVLDEDLPEIIQAGKGRMALVYRRETEEGGCTSARVFLRLIGERPPNVRSRPIR